LVDQGAKNVVGYVTHGVLSGGAISRINDSALIEMVTTDSILATEAFKVSDKMRQLSIAPLMGEAMKRISQETSVSSLFD